MMVQEEQGIRWLTFKLLSQFPNVHHGVFMRGEGTFSLSGSPDAAENQEKVKEIFCINNLISAYQVHGKEVIYIDEDSENLQRCDGLMTDRKEICLMIKHADCQAAIFYDPCNHAIANVHCGWKGSVKNIYAAVIEEMKQKFSTNPKHLVVCIGPSLGPESSEFIHYRTELPSHFWKYQIKPAFFNFWKISESQLKDCGVPAGQIEIAGIDTYQNEDCFSYRKNKHSGKDGKEGHGTVVYLS